jgi:WD40 repeat protein
VSSALSLDRDNPWPGLAPYDEEAQLFFNGRGSDTAELLRRVKDAPVTLLFGKSGLGKSSLLRAGLFPFLRRERFLPVYLRLDVQDASAPLIEQLARALAEECHRQRVDATARAAGETLWAYLHRTDFELWSDKNQLLTPVFVLDQFEEVFTIGAANEAAMDQLRIDLGDLAENRIPATLKRSIEASPQPEGALDLKAMRCRLVIALREDFLPHLEGWRGAIPSLMRNRMRLLPMNREQAYTVVYDSAPHLVSKPVAQRIVLFVAGTRLPEASQAAEATETETQAQGGHIEPALLSLVCQGLNEQRKRQGKDRIDESMLAAGVQQTIVSDYYRECVAPLPEAAQHFIEEELITEQGFRNSYSVADAIDSGVLDREQIAKLVDRRLLRVEEWRGAPRIELTHDLLTHAVREHRDRRRAEQAQRAAAERLQAEKSEFEVRSRQQRRRFIFVGVLAAVFLGFALFAVVQWKRAAEAEAQSKQALAQALAGKFALQSSLVLDARAPGGVDIGVLLAVAAARSSLSSDARRMLRIALDRTAALQWSQKTGEKSTYSAAFSRDGRTLAFAGRDGTVRVWDLARRQPVGEPLRGHEGEVRGVAFSPDGKNLASAGADGTVRLWDLTRRQPRGEPLRGHQGSIYGVAFSGDGRTLASVGLEGIVRLWDIVRQQPLGEPLLGHQGSTRSVAFSPDGRTLASAGTEGTVRLWDIVRGQPLGAPLSGHKGSVLGVAFSPDGKTLASAGEDGTRLWDVVRRQPSDDPLRGFQGWAHSVAFSPDGKTLASAGIGGIVWLWDIASRQPLGASLRGHEGSVLGVTFSPDGKTLASAGDDGTVRLWEVARREPLGETLRGHGGWVLGVDFSPDRKTLASGGDDGTVRLWDIASRQSLGEPLRGHEGWISSVDFSPDSKTLASAGQDGTVRLWDPVRRQPLGEPLRGHQGWASTVDFSPDGKTLASGGQDGTVNLWDHGRRQRLGEPLLGHQGEISSVAFRADGMTLASAGYDGTVRLWDLARRQPLGEPLSGHQGRVLSVAFSPDGTTLASASQDAYVRLWDLARRQPLGEPLHGHTSRVVSVAFSPDGTTLASAGQDATVRLWEVARRQLLGDPLRGHEGEVASVAFSPDGKTVASAGYDGTVRLWDVDPESWMRKLCAKLSRNLSLEEWARYAGDFPYQPQCPDLPIPGQ